MRPVRWGLHPPPRSPMRTDVSRSLSDSPQFAGVSAGSNADVRSLPLAEVARASILAAGLWALQTRSWRATLDAWNLDWRAGKGPDQCHRTRTEIVVIVFGFRRPVIPKRPFNTATHSPARSRLAGRFLLGLLRVYCRDAEFSTAMGRQACSQIY